MVLYCIVLIYIYLMTNGVFHVLLNICIFPRYVHILMMSIVNVREREEEEEEKRKEGIIFSLVHL